MKDAAFLTSLFDAAVEAADFLMGAVVQIYLAHCRIPEVEPEHIVEIAYQRRFDRYVLAMLKVHYPVNMPGKSGQIGIQRRLLSIVCVSLETQVNKVTYHIGFPFQRSVTRILLFCGP